MQAWIPGHITVFSPPEWAVEGQDILHHPVRPIHVPRAQSVVLQSDDAILRAMWVSARDFAEKQKQDKEDNHG